MNIILLSGGSGKRLWPLSNDIRSKQFIKFFPNENGEYESMVQRVYEHILEVDEKADITVATAKTHVITLKNHLGDNISICVEPCRRDTFPAVVLACCYLKDIKHISESETIVVCPVDPYVEKEYFSALFDLGKCAQTGESNLYLMGIKPTYPSAKYGYIIPENTDILSKVVSFKEKPDEATAQKYIEQGELWNGGIFAFKLNYIIEKCKEITGYDSYNELLEHYFDLEKISFDYAVSEKEKDIKVMLFSGDWKDLGTWNTLTEALQDNIVGNAIIDKTSDNVHVINELNVPILCMGIKDAVISASNNGILISDKNQSSFIKPYVDKIEDRVMFAEKSWGSYKVIDVEDESMTIKVTLNPGHQMHYHSHEHRDEVWNVVSGNGTAIINSQRINVKPGDILNIKAGIRHTIIAKTELKLIETQLGKEISVNDKIKYDTLF